MSIPLDRLYNFLQDIASRNDHVIIYRFYPHGSRKISDLTQLESYNLQGKKSVDAKLVFFHDQEPLNFDLYASPNMLSEIVSSDIFIKQALNSELTAQFQTFLSNMAPMINLRITTIRNRGLLKPAILVHSEKRSGELERYRSANFLGVYWWCHAVIARDWFRYAEHDPTLIVKKSSAKDFLIYNRAWTGTREYRLKLTESLITHGLVDHCVSWFSPVDDGLNYQQHQFKNTQFQISQNDLEQYFDATRATSTASADYCAQDYQNTQIEIVLETLFDDARLHLTEKILRPIACAQPFMLAATQGSLDYLRSYGFETFHPWIDETYDTISDPAQRLEAIVQEMKRIAGLSPDEKTRLYTALKEITARNKKLFFSDAWQQTIVGEFQTNFSIACDQLEQMIKYPI